MLSDESDHKASQSEDSADEYSNLLSGKCYVEEKNSSLNAKIIDVLLIAALIFFKFSQNFFF